MASSRNISYLMLAARLWVGAVLAFAGFMKLMEPTANFQAALEQYPLIPPAFLPILAQTVPWIEWIGGSFLVLGYMTRVLAFIFVFFCLGFIAVLSGPVWAGSAAKDCGCFGQGAFALTVNQAYILDWTNLILCSLLVSVKKNIFSLDQLFL
ncbi:MAG: hypothetical protein A2036_04060 [Omnitrophica bacterium GWA2_50_21]|nr:MAG: hypothetical protein A2036_04060 [Omnitrophica bacterium GWA2_50_21]